MGVYLIAIMGNTLSITSMKSATNEEFKNLAKNYGVTYNTIKEFENDVNNSIMDILTNYYIRFI